MPTTKVNLSFKDVQWLSEHARGQGMVVSCYADTHRGRLYTFVPGAMHMIEEINEPVPKRHRAVGELWGKQQATIARHREDHIVHYLTGLAGEIQRAWPEERYDGIVLLGEHQVLETLRGYLPEALRSRVAGEVPHAWVGRPTPLVSTIESIHAEALRDQAQRLFEDIKGRLLDDHQIAAGPQAVIDAIENGPIGHSGSVVMESDRREVGSRCTSCRKLLAQAVSECPSCHARSEKTNLWQTIALSASNKHVTVHFVDPGRGVDTHGGVVALLAREAPWMTPRERVLTASLPERRA